MTYSQRTKEEAQDYRYFPEPDIPPMTFSKQFIDSIIVPELPQQKMDRYITVLKVKQTDAFTLTREKSAADFFEKVISQTQIIPQTIANVIINKKPGNDVNVDEFIKNIKERLAPIKTDEKALEDLINCLVSSNPKVVDDYKKGKVNAIMFLVGQAMREMKGKADAKLIIAKIKSKIR